MQTYGDVTVRPIAQKPTLFPEPDMAPVAMQEPMTPENFIPPQAERAPVRAPRMPQFEELPMPAQAEIRQARGEVEEETPQKTRLSLLQRLANVGLGRRDEESEPPSRPAPPVPRCRRCPIAAAEDAWRSRSRRRAGIGVCPPSCAAGPGHAWPSGACCAAPQGDDHLDIPAFLRRQAT